MSDTTDFDSWKNWDAKSQALLADRLATTVGSGEPRLWFCDRGRVCDGKPHEGFDYPHARGKQWPPPGNDWTTWFLSGGRGSGKSATGSQYTRKVTEKIPRSILIGPTVTHVRDVMVEGDSGIMAAFDAAKVRAQWEPSKRRITNLANGHIVFALTGEEPDRLRGHNSGFCWLDEPAHMPLISELWDLALLGLRVGLRPHVLCTTTPLPTDWVRERIAEEDTAYVVMPTYENLDNLAPTFRKAVLRKYEGTRLGRQELMGEVIEDVEGALWDMSMIEENRSDLTYKDMERAVVSVDPAGTSSNRRDETGIIGLGRLGDNIYVLADASGHYSPDGWAKAAWKMYDDLGADAIVAEKNYGGDMVRSTMTNARQHMLGTSAIAEEITMVNSRRGKEIRAEPVVGLYEQGRALHCGTFPVLETQMCSWVPGLGRSPDRVDALVHGARELASSVRGDMHVSVPRGSFDLSVGTRKSRVRSIFSKAVGL